MAVIKEFRCLAHGAFDGTEARCPHGCTTVLREFRTAPGTRSAKTKISDKALDRMAKQFGATNMTNRSGTMKLNRGVPQFEGQWGQMPKGNAWDGKGEKPVDGAAGGAMGALSALNMAPEQKGDPNIAQIMKNLPRRSPNVVGNFSSPAELEKLAK